MTDTAIINVTLVKPAVMILPAPPVCCAEVTAALFAPATDGVLLPLCLPIVLLWPLIMVLFDDWLVEDEEVALLVLELILEVLLDFVVPLIHCAKVGKV